MIRPEAQQLTSRSGGFTHMGKLFKIILPIALVAGLAFAFSKKRGAA